MARDHMSAHSPGRGWHVSAIDIDPNLLEVARHRLEESEVTNCEFIAGDAYDIATLTAPADFVFMANAFSWRP